MNKTLSLSHSISQSRRGDLCLADKLCSVRLEMGAGKGVPFPSLPHSHSLTLDTLYHLLPVQAEISPSHTLALAGASAWTILYSW